MKKRRMRKEMNVKAVILAIAVLIIIGAFLLLGAEREPEDKKKVDNKRGECSIDEECVPASCCHAASCVAKEQAPQCSGMYCTQVCLPDTLDCNQARCACVEKRCRAVKNEGE